MCFTETWLDERTPDAMVALDGFMLVRFDRCMKATGKKKGGGVAVYLSERWCSPANIHVKQQLCTKDLEMVVVSARPFYLPREFTHVLVLCVYIPPSADAAEVCELLHTTVSQLQNKHPRALLVISGDFNHASLSTTLPTFKQYVSCGTRSTKTLDLLYANVQDAYTSTALPPLGRSDHNLVSLRPQYVPVVRRQVVKKKTVRKWTKEANGSLQDCFATTDWNALCDPHGEDIDGLTQCITDYINFCVDSNVETKRIRCFPNNHPWVTSELKVLLSQKKRAFYLGNKEEQKRVQKELQWRIRRAKKDYGKKMEEKLAQNNARDVWSGLRAMSGLTQNTNETADGDIQWAEELNTYFNRFNPYSTSTAPSSPTPSLQLSITPPPSHSSLTHQPLSLLPYQPTTDIVSPPLSFSPDEVRAQLRRLKVSKSTGPDGVHPRVLRTCAEQLCEVLCRIFNLSLSLEKVPVLWKTSCIVPVPKTPKAKEPGHYRPVALTSHLMKTMERLIMDHLRGVVNPTMDPLQFAYKQNIGVEDGVLYLQQRALAHLETAGNAVRVMFFDFSSAFNTIRPALLKGKLEKAGVDGSLTSWLMDYLTDRPQYVRLRGCESGVVVSSTGAPQGTVLSPFLFTIYTSDFTYDTESCHLQKFSDDSAIIARVSEGNEAEYRSVIMDFVNWCERNHLLLNTSKTKEMVIDFRRRPTPHSPVNIQGENIEVVESFKYLGVHINNKLDWSHNTQALYKKSLSRLHLLRRLRSFGVSRPLLKTFYHSIVASALFYATVCWAPGSTERDKNKLNRLVKRASSVLGCPLDSVDEVKRKRVLDKVKSIMTNTFHPMHTSLVTLRSSVSGRLKHPQCKTERYRRSFIPTAVRLYNHNT